MIGASERIWDSQLLSDYFLHGAEVPIQYLSKGAESFRCWLCSSWLMVLCSLLVPFTLLSSSVWKRRKQIQATTLKHFKYQCLDILDNLFFLFQKWHNNHWFSWGWATLIIIRQNITSQFTFQCSKIPILAFWNVSSEIGYNTSGISLLNLSRIDSDLSIHRKDHVANHSQLWLLFWLCPLPLTLGKMFYVVTAEQLYYFYSLKWEKQSFLNIHTALFKYICRADYCMRPL